VETSTPIASPRAPSPKRPKIGLGESCDVLAGSSTTPPLDDVSIFAAILFCQSYLLPFVEFFPF
jgi:hypothetical protein